MDSQNITPLFVIDNDPVVEWPVVVRIPTAGGKFTEYQFGVSMRVLAPAEYEELFKSGVGNMSVSEADIESASSRELSEVLKLNAQVFKRLIVGWDSSVVDRSGTAVPFSPEKLEAQILGARGPALSVGIWRAINEVRFGVRMGGDTQPGAQTGN